MTTVLAAEYAGDRPVVIPAQVLFLNPFLAPVWIGGLFWLLRSPRAAQFRALAWVWPAVTAAVLVTAGQVYYPAPATLPLFAAGGVWLEQRQPLRRGRGLVTAIVVAAVPALLFIPALPPDVVPKLPEDVNYDLLEMVGWPQLAATVGNAYRSLPPRLREGAVIVTSNYGEAGAIERYRGAVGIPDEVPVASGHNSYASWGPPPDARDGPVITVGNPAFSSQPVCEGRAEVARVANPYGVDNEEAGLPVAVCPYPAAPWSQLWPRLRHFG